MHILLVEDDASTAESLQRGLARYGYEVSWVPTGREALIAPMPGMVLLDLGLPDIDGLDVCRELRTRSDVPLIVISGRGSEMERVVGLELGADDYIVKPYLVRELIARMRTVLRRSLAAPETRGPGPGEDAYRLERSGACSPDCPYEPCRPDVRHGLREAYGRVAVDRRAHRVFLDEAEVPLTPKEYALLAFLTSRFDTLVTRETIMTEVWDSNWFGSTKTLDVHVAALRNKLGDALSFECVRGVGFRLGVRPQVPRTSWGQSAS
ncbi:response regulator transcription factor [Streptomyces sp. NPDC048251]|uniref:response regulator transcription factor n=1 Tax=Streptomyces sp. NPDC048251 TaxID=3154501 RepID=UPI003415A8BC